jgi:hypothetical protein
MEISYAFFAEAAQITSDGRLNILGADLPILTVKGQPPWSVGMIFLVVSIQFESEDGGHLYHFTADLIAPEGERIEPHMEQDFVAPVPENAERIGRMSVVLQLTGLSLPGSGVYHMQVRVEDRERNIVQERLVRLRVEEVAPPNQPG